MVNSHIIFLLKVRVYRILNSIPTFQKQIHIEIWGKMIKYIRRSDNIPRPRILICVETMIMFFFQILTTLWYPS